MEIILYQNIYAASQQFRKNSGMQCSAALINEIKTEQSHIFCTAETLD